MGLRQKYQQAAERYVEARENPRSPKGVPLTTNQHILHLLLTVFTVGLWARCGSSGPSEATGSLGCRKSPGA
jgi:hypothetical protein